MRARIAAAIATTMCIALYGCSSARAGRPDAAVVGADGSSGQRCEPIYPPPGSKAPIIVPQPALDAALVTFTVTEAAAIEITGAPGAAHQVLAGERCDGDSSAIVVFVMDLDGEAEPTQTNANPDGSFTVFLSARADGRIRFWTEMGEAMRSVSIDLTSTSADGATRAVEWAYASCVTLGGSPDYDLGGGPIGTPPHGGFGVSNDCGADLVLRAVSLRRGADYGSPFAIRSDPPPIVIADSTYATIQVEFTPVEPGSALDVVRMETEPDGAWLQPSTVRASVY